MCALGMHNKPMSCTAIKMCTSNQWIRRHFSFYYILMAYKLHIIRICTLTHTTVISHTFAVYLLLMYCLLIYCLFILSAVVQTLQKGDSLPDTVAAISSSVNKVFSFCNIVSLSPGTESCCEPD